MLTITIQGSEFFDETIEEFIYPECVQLQLEHSLASLSKWESIYEKPFLGKEEKTVDEILDYIYLMILTPGISKDVLQSMSEDNFKEIQKYVNAKMTATWFSDTKGESRSSEVITSELIYYWMSEFSIPIECENWHLNRLFTRIKISSLKSQKPKKMSRSEIATRNRELNARRRAELQTNG